MKEYPRQPWSEHISRLKWKQGEHVLVCAPTGHGKTFLMSRILEKRGHVVVFTGKARDDTLAKEFPGYERFTTWREPKLWEEKILLWPKHADTIAENKARLKQEFTRALDGIWKHGNRCIVVDESLQFTDARELGLGTELSHVMQQGRSFGLSVVVLTQRPSWIPKIVYSSVAHAYISRTRDRSDETRLGDFAGVDSHELRSNVRRLPGKFDYVYVNPHGDGQSVVVNTKKG